MEHTTTFCSSRIHRTGPSIPADLRGHQASFDPVVNQHHRGKSRFHCLDVWHSLHLGVGKAWAASGIMMLQKYLPESNVDLRIAVFAAGYREFCRRMKLDPVIRKIDVHTFGGGGSEEPNGCWNKACITSNFLMFLEDFLSKHPELLVTEENRVFDPRIILVERVYSNVLDILVFFFRSADGCKFI